MIIFCEECAEKFSFPPEKVDPEIGTFRCSKCGFLMPAALFQEGKYKKVNPESTAKGPGSPPRKRRRI
ncbi:MAG: zinc-ribbon domain-containing protein [Desulfobulbaceae bacterium]|uniref:Zinc-ribbon domain-containing protein n=1 Tax=Candidatus Desulfobia pelagia TaxID=2841692 RepID=A0A8J6N8Z0_9BACT|nr:zinc-ribbon domain-containing protein [Candidatus Desulfobia pelagia]